MSMRISSAAALLALAVAGCDQVQQQAPNRLSLNVAGEAVNVVAPQGLCFDPRSTEVNSNGAFLLVADCDVTGAGDADGAALNAVMTATIANTGLPGTLQDLRTFFSGPAAASLGKSGDAAKVSVASSEIVDDVLLIKVRDEGEQPLPNASPDFWRAFFEAGHRLVGLSMVSFQGTEVADSDARALLRSFAQATIAANPEEAPEPVPAEAAAPEDIEAIVGAALDEAGAGEAAAPQN